MIRLNKFNAALATLFCVVVLAATLVAQNATPVKRAVGKPTAFKVTVTKVELYNGTSFVTVFSGSAQLDLVSAGAGAAFPGISGVALPRGTYSQIRVTFANQFGMQGSLAYSGLTWYVTSTAVADTGGAAAQGSAVPGSAGEATVMNPDWGVMGASTSQTMTIPSITVTSTTDYQPTVKFDLSNSLELWEVGGISRYFTLAPITITVL